MTPSSFSRLTRVDLDWFELLWLFLTLKSLSTRFFTWLVFDWMKLPFLECSIVEATHSCQLAWFRWKWFNSSVDDVNVCSLLSPSAKFLPLLCSPPNAMLGGKRETFLDNKGFDRETVSLVKSELNKCWIMIGTHYSGPRFHIKYILDTLSRC